MRLRATSGRITPVIRDVDHEHIDGLAPWTHRRTSRNWRRIVTRAVVIWLIWTAAGAGASTTCQRRRGRRIPPPNPRDPGWTGGRRRARRRLWSRHAGEGSDDRGLAADLSILGRHRGGG